MAFSDANKARYGVLILREGKDTAHILPNPNSVQLGELFGLLKIFDCYQQEPVNIFWDNQYVVQTDCTLPPPILKSKKVLYISACDLSRRLLRIGHIPGSLHI